MSTVKRFVVIQAMTFVFGIVGPIFLIGYFAAQPDSTLKWMYWWALLITAADVLIALGLTNSLTKSETQQRQQQTSED